MQGKLKLFRHSEYFIYTSAMIGPFPIKVINLPSRFSFTQPVRWGWLTAQYISNQFYCSPNYILIRFSILDTSIHVSVEISLVAYLPSWLTLMATFHIISWEWMLRLKAVMWIWVLSCSSHEKMLLALFASTGTLICCFMPTLATNLYNSVY